MKIENARYINEDKNIIEAIIDGVQTYIPVDSSNRHYNEFIKQNINIIG